MPFSPPSSFEEFKEYCLRKLGKPVIEINIDDDQLTDRVYEALKMFYDYHFDGTETVYYAYIPTVDDINNKYITLPDGFIGVVDVFSIGDPSVRADDLFNIRYQIALNDLYTLTSVSMIPYYMVMEHLALVTEFLVGKQPLRYNRITQRCYIDTDWNNFGEGMYIMLRAYAVLDAKEWPNVFGEPWLQRYATALIGEQWGKNLIKFEGMELPGGVKFNGEKIYRMYHDERVELEKRVIEDFSLPLLDMVN